MSVSILNCLLQFRKNDIADIPEAEVDTEEISMSDGSYDIYDSQGPEDDRPVNWEAIEANLNPSTKSIMSGSPTSF